MNLLSAFFAAISIVSAVIGILDAIERRQPQRRRFAWTTAIVFLVIFVLSIPFANILAPSGNSGSSSPQTSSVSTIANNTQAGTVNISVPTATPLPADTPTPSLPGPGTQLFPKNGVKWFNGWTGGSDWYTSGNMMLNNGQQIKSMSLAPYHPGDDNVSDYSVDVEMQLNRWSDDMGSDSFGIIVRSPDGQKGYIF